MKRVFDFFCEDCKIEFKEYVFGSSCMECGGKILVRPVKTWKESKIELKVNGKHLFN